MSKLFPGRYAATIEGPFVVFLIGMRINRLFAIHKWLPVARAMPPMLKELYANKDSGFLHAEFAIQWPGVTTIQYWRSFEALHAYAHDRDAKHMPAWAAFNRAVGNNGSVGIWHETYEIDPGHYESIYVNMPRWGLSAAGEHASAIGRLNNTTSRMAARNSTP
jgi:hypothetical protein